MLEPENSGDEENCHGYPREVLESVAVFAFESVLQTGQYGFNYSQQVGEYLKEKARFQAYTYARSPEYTIDEFHDYWLGCMLELGWKYATKIDNDKKISTHIYPFRFLPGYNKKELKEYRKIILQKLNKYKEKGYI